MTLGQNVPKLDALHLMDGIEGLRSLPKHSVDMLLTDPPYGTTRNFWDVPLPLPAAVSPAPGRSSRSTAQHGPWPALPTAQSTHAPTIRSIRTSSRLSRSVKQRIADGYRLPEASITAAPVIVPPHT